MGRFGWLALVAAAVVTGAVVALLLIGDDDDPEEPEPEAILPLLGTPGEVPDRPALAVKIDGTERGRPQTGLTQADVVYEELVEGGLTRLLAVYHSADPEMVGPVRSARSTDISLLAELDRPLFAWSGANEVFRAAVEAADIIDVGFAAAAEAYQQSPERQAPYNLDASPERLRSAGGEGGPPPALFGYRDPDETLDEPEVETVTAMTLDGPGLAPSIDWEWDEESAAWRRTQDGMPHVDADGEPVAVANVVVRVTPYEDTGLVDSAGNPVPQAITVGEGEVLLLSDGTLRRGRWHQPSELGPTTYTDANGDPLRLTPGQTWIEVLPPGTVQLDQPPDA